MKRTIGLLAHVDAGKTTFAEQVLALSHTIRRAGRVDHQDTFMDTDPQERARGITIFAGQAVIRSGEDVTYLLDTPGHVDFSAEMERALRMLDAAILIVSAAEGVQPHTETLWRLLRQYEVPTFVFLNKTDREAADPDAVLALMRRRLSPDMPDLRGCDLTHGLTETAREEIATLDEGLMERYFAGDYDERLWLDTLSEAVMRRAAFPVMAGSALLGEGVAAFFDLVCVLTRTRYDASAPLCGQVWRVRRDERGTRLCTVKLSGGRLRVKDTLEAQGTQMKINELRLCHGERFQTLQEAEAGDIVDIPGLETMKPGDVFGTAARRAFRLEPMMAVDVQAEGVTGDQLMQALRTLEEEEPTLGVVQRPGGISVRMMGLMQMDILRAQLAARFGMAVTFGRQHVLYRETVAVPTIGIGHYEPLRHYAEVWLRIVPGEPGSGVRFRSLAHVDDLALNWQRLIETHVLEKEHNGVLTGSPLTDVTIELLCGRAHLKHTEGGDFRQAVYRAIRMGLMRGQSVLLEPLCGFELRVPSTLYGSIAASLTRLQATVEAPAYEGEEVLLRGEAPYALFAPWQADFMRLTHGQGSLRVWNSRYAPCHNSAEVVSVAAYDPLAVPEDTPDSVFCSHGAGFRVAWEQVPSWAHCAWVGEETTRK